LESAKNDDFVAEFQKTSSKLVPRVRIELQQQQQLSSLSATTLANAILTVAADFDGIVLEPGFYHAEWIEQVGQRLHDANKIFILVLPPSTTPVTFENVDYFSIMTYDYSYGPIAPWRWVKQTMERMCGGDCGRFFIGLNFYGYDDKGEALTGSNVLDLLRKHKPRLEWDRDAEEHWFTYGTGGSKRRVYYPSLLVRSYMSSG
jgi:hypothetical protein